MCRWIISLLMRNVQELLIMRLSHREISVRCCMQMPKGVPVATVAIGNAANAGLLAVRILASSDQGLLKRMLDYQVHSQTFALNLIKLFILIMLVVSLALNSSRFAYLGSGFFLKPSLHINVVLRATAQRHLNK